jgi:hypothetical protein
MLISDFAVCLGVKSFKDNLKILDVFSKEYGRFSALLRIGKKQGIPVPLSVIKFDFFKKEFGLCVIKKFDVIASNSISTLTPIAATTSLFLCELIQKTVPEFYVNEHVYSILLTSGEELRQQPSNSIIALKFSLSFLKELGVLNDASDLFQFQKLPVKLQQFVEIILQNKFSNFILTGSEKKTIMECCLQHLRIHFQTKLELNSLDYFHIVFQTP